MNPKHTAPLPPSPGMSLVDIYYILFRHKRLIAIISSVALATAITVRLLWPVPYQSEAELLIKYIKETKPLQESVAESQLTRPDVRGENIVNSEISILTSFDLAVDVATSIGPAKILGKTGGATNVSPLDAAIMIKKGLVIPQDPTRGDIIRMAFFHPNSDMVAPILSKIIEVYQTRHTAIHNPEYNEFLTQRRDQFKAQQQALDKQLREMKISSSIMTIEDSKKNYNELLSGIQVQLNDAEAEQAAYQETIRQMQRRLLSATSMTAASTSAADMTNQPAPIPAGTTTDYQRICTRLAAQKERETQLLGTFTTNYPEVQTEQAQIVKTEAEKAALEEQFPGLLALKPLDTRGTSAADKPGMDPREVLYQESIRANALAAKIQFLTNRLAEIQSSGTNLITQEGPLTQLQTEKSLAESQYNYYQQRLDEDQVNSALGPGNSDFSIVESPTPPSRDTIKLNKITLEIFLGGVALAFGLSFLIELCLDRSLKRPMDVQIRLGLPFFISIPQMGGNGKPRALKNAKWKALLPGKKKTLLPGRKKALLPSKTEAAGDPQPAPPPNGHLALWEERHSLQPFYETLRDRLMTYFEMINLTHKPKLVAVTSCDEGAGVTSTAAGLASSLSETGDGNVLLVNMNIRDGETQHFHKGKLACGLEEVLEKETRENALVQGRLYVAKELPEDDRLPRVLPKRFSHLLPKMKASDFDYIIFDMPPVSQISITPRLARFMDMVLLVIESEKTDRDVAKHVATMLSESKTNVGIVLNKNRSDLPRQLRQEF
jgi:polysaccharide biosynthesis transport protein